MEISAERQAVVDEARSYLGVKWLHQGRTRESGIDCVGLPLLVGEELGYIERGHGPQNYPRRPNYTFIPVFRQYLDTVVPSEQQLGDVLVFAENSQPCHCGILSQDINGLTVIHAHANDRKVIEEPLTRAIGYLGKPVFRFKFKGVI